MRYTQGSILLSPTFFWETFPKRYLKFKKMQQLMCVYPLSREEGINLFGDRRGSILLKGAEISQEG